MNQPREIQPAAADGVNLVQISDTHLLGDPGARFDGVDTAVTLAGVVDAVGRLQPRPDAILLTGDLAHEAEAEAYARLTELLAPLPAPVFCIPGNHDDPEMMRRCLTGGPYLDKSLVAGSWRILLLDTWKPGSHAGRLAPGELRFLEQQLQVSPQPHTLIALHHPPVSVASPWMDAMGLENAGEFLALLDRQDTVRAVIWGHIHQDYEECRNGVRLLGVPSTCIQFLPGADRYTRDSREPGFRQLFLEAGGGIGSVVRRVPMPAASGL